jgi:sugar phosphate isomerase/epimerase
MLPFGNKDSYGGPIHDAEPEEWAKHLRLVRRIGFTEVDPTDTWVRVGELSPERLADFKAVLSDVGLRIPAISTSRRSVMDPEHGQGAPRLQSPAARRGGGAGRHDWSAFASSRS